MLKLVSIAIPDDEHTRRAVIVANALAVQDLSAGRPETREDFEALIGEPPPGGWPLDVPFHIDPKTGKTQGVSLCAVVARGIQARSGVVILSWGKTYDSSDKGNALVELENRARKANAWRAKGDSTPPEPGDTITTLDYGGHVMTVVKREGNALWTVEGGQVDSERGGLQCIKPRERTWGKLNLWGVCNVAKLPWAPEGLAPEGSAIVSDPKDAGRVWPSL